MDRTPNKPPRSRDGHRRGAAQNDVKRILERIEGSQKAHAPHVRVWEKLRKYRAGNHYRLEEGSGPWLDGERYVQAINLLHSWEETIRPKLLYRRPEFLIEPARITDPSQAAQIWESAHALQMRTNALVQEIRAVDQFRLSLSAAMFSAGVLQVGFDLAMGEMTGEAEAADNTGEKVAVDLNLARSQNQEYLDGGLPFVKWIPATRFNPDPSATRIDDASWIAVEYFRTVQDLKLDPQIDPAFTANLKETHRLIPDPYMTQSGEERPRDPQLGMVKMYAFYDRHKKRIQHLAGKGAGAQVIAYEAEWEPAIEGYPFHMLGFTTIPGQFWPLPPMSAWFGAAYLMDELASHAAEQATKAKQVNAYDTKKISEAEAGTVADADDGELVGVPDVDAFKAIEMGGVNRTQLDLMLQLKGWIDLVAGTSDTQRGVMAPGERPTAAEVQSTLDSAGFRTEDMKRTHHDHLSRVGTDLVALVIYYKNEMSDMVLVADAARRQTVDFAQPIVGELVNYRLRVEPTSTERLDRAKSLQRSESLIGLLSDPNIQMAIQPSGKSVNLVPVIEEQIRNLGMPDPSRVLVDAPPPMPGPGDMPPGGAMPPEQGGAPQPGAAMGQQGGPMPPQDAALPQQETEAILAGQPIEASPNDDHAAHLAVHVPALEQTQDANLAEHVAMHERFLEVMGAPQGPPVMAGAV